MAVAIYNHTLNEIKRRLPNEKKARRAAARAINRAMDAGKTQAVRELSKDYTVKQRKVKAKFTSTRATPDKLLSRITWRGYATNLGDFSVTPGKPAPAKRPILRATVARARGPVPYRGAFLVNLRAGGTKVFRRTTEAKDFGLRLPITGVWGPSIPQLLSARNVRDAVESRALAVLDSRIAHEIDRELRG